jgi:2',3'-cyclic-nucleotide 2'-phosphodiesterase (5'-nucleotidase family)
MKRIDGITRPLLKRLTGKLIVSITLLALLFPLSLFATPPSDIHLTILHVNDTHGYILPYTETSSKNNTMVGGAAYLARLIENERSKNPEGTLLLSAGDMFQGTPISNFFKGQPVIDLMNHLKFDTMAVANHEFDWGFDVFNRMLSSARFPFLSANMKSGKDQYFPGVKPYIIVHRKNVNIAVIGVITPDLSYLSKPDSTGKITVQNPEDILPELIKKVKDEGAHIVMVLSHLGVEEDKELARRVSGIHVIVGGHSHTPLETPVTIGNTVIVQAGGYGLYLGVLELEIDTGTNPVSYRIIRGKLEKVLAGPDRPYDETVARIVNSYHDRIKNEFAGVVGATTVDLMRKDQRESNIGNLVCDMMRETTGADIALLNSRSIRTDIPRGKITLEQVYALLPFDNVLVTMDLTGRQLMEILEHSATQPYRRLQVSGIRITHDFSNSGGRLVREVRVGMRPLDLNKTYRIATNDFLAAGGDRFATFKEGQNISYGMDLRDAFLSYLKKRSPVQPRIEERIIILPTSYHHRQFPQRVSIQPFFSDLRPQLCFA